VLFIDGGHGKVVLMGMQTLHGVGFNPKTPPTPICHVWMTLKLPRSQEKVIFYPILGQLGKEVVHHIQLKNHFERSPSFCKNEFYKKKWMTV
jgi:hypothetical protein